MNLSSNRLSFLARLIGIGLLAVGALEQTRAQEPAAAAPQAIEFFERHVRPLLSEHCLACHGEKQKGGLRLDSRAAMLTGGDSGSAIVPGQPSESRLIQAVEYHDEPKMPPDGRLPDAAVATLTEWIRLGAPWPAGEEKAATASHPDAAKDHWAFQPIRKPALPEVKDRLWPANPIDKFILAELEACGLAPSAAADPRVQLRRASFDVTGLPPSPELQALATAAPENWSAIVENLLASPHFGERWARHWLDLARYADTKGYLFTQDRSYPNAYRYRDWVVQAFNTDMPYDEFLVRQIAADRLPRERVGELAAMGFLTVGRRFLNNPQDIIDDRIDVLARGTMALTVSCARCHDHKYDPIPTKDYYSLYGVLASSVEPSEPAEYMTLADAAQPVVPHVFVRGNAGNHGEAVPRQFLSVIAGENQQPFGPGSGRLELARAIASPDNPLTARVIVNRVWMVYFDKPLVATPSDFGMRSEPPTHPALLDYLASYLIEHHWSLKDLHRLILESATYRQSSIDRAECRQVDADNRLLWRMNRKRLDFEGLRDALLASSGLLDRTLGGPAAELTKSPTCRRRTLYGLIDRQNLPNVFRTFDFASPDTHAPMRFTTVVPQQALYMMNSPFVVEMARSLAGQFATADGVDAIKRVTRLYERLFARRPADGELQIALAFLKQEESLEPSTPAATSDPNKLSPWERYVQAVLLSNEFMYVD